MKYKIWEKVLNEYVGAPDAVLLSEIEANSLAEACQIAEKTYPNKTTLKVDDGNVAIEFDV
jgi:hypothetical protein